ncbi:MAG: hypothetical protein WAO19_04465 [Candidatus Kryptoniota bacterium]
MKLLSCVTILIAFWLAGCSHETKNKPEYIGLERAPDSLVKVLPLEKSTLFLETGVANSTSCGSNQSTHTQRSIVFVLHNVSDSTLYIPDPWINGNYIGVGTLSYRIHGLDDNFTDGRHMLDVYAIPERFIMLKSEEKLYLTIPLPSKGFVQGHRYLIYGNFGSNYPAFKDSSGTHSAWIGLIESRPFEFRY